MIFRKYTLTQRIMGTLGKGLLKNKCQIQLQFVRCKTKVSVTRPRPPYFERALVETVCLPYFSTKKRPQHIPYFDTCTGQESSIKTEKDHPLEKILGEESLNKFNSSKLIAFYHLNSLTPEEKFQYQLLMKKNGMKLLFLNKTILQKAFKDTMYETIVNLYNSPTATAISPEPNISKLLSIDKKVPKLSLMAAIVEKKLLSFSELQSYGKFNDITEARGSLVFVLNSALQNLVQDINYHPQNLVQQLNQQKKLLEENTNKG